MAIGEHAAEHEFSLSTHKLRYVTWGSSENPSIVLIHGGLDNAWTWQDLALRLAGDWHVYALHLRGHGDSDWSSTGDYLPASYLADVAYFLKNVVGCPAQVVGHSMGARLMLQLMGSVPELVEALVAIEGLGAEEPPADDVIDDGMRQWISDRAGRAKRSDVEQFGDWLRTRIAAKRHSSSHFDLESRIARQLADRKKGLSLPQAEAFVRSNMRRSDEGWIWKFDPLARWQASHEIVETQLPYWSAISGPVLHIYGSESWAYPPRSAKLDAFADAELAVISGAGHWVQMNRPEEVALRIDEFFKRTKSREA